MPFKSQAQRRFMYATNPELAKEMESKTPKGKKLPNKSKEKAAAILELRGKSDSGSSTPHQLGRAAVGGGLAGLGAGLGTQKIHYELNKEYYNKISDALRQAGTAGEKELASTIRNKVPLFGKYFSKKVPQGEIAKKIPEFSAISDDVASGSRRLGKVTGVGAAALTAGVILALEKMRAAEMKSKKASPYKEYLNKVGIYS